MATSLAEQLQRLKVPQTSVLIDSKAKPSILFDRKEAATKDRKTIFELGQSGIFELIALNPAFTQFEKTLFDPDSINLERSVEDVEINRLLDKAIKKFFYHLSPFFMLQPAHLCLEWLIRRFHIHQFNVDEFIDLILPYHETRIFVKCLQVMRISEPSGKWIWLKASRKAGVPLSKTALQNRAANDTIFLHSICNSIIESIRELDNRSNTLQTKINFYCITVIAALENAKSITESHISCILPSILKGFSSSSLDFAASSFMITAQLIFKVNLKREFLETIISKICAVEHKTLQVDIISLLILIYQSQNNIQNFPEELLINFISKKSIIRNINELSIRKIKVSTLCVPLIRACFDIIHSKDAEWIKCKEFLTNLFDDVCFQEYESKNIIRSILENNQSSKREYLEDDVVELDSSDENELLQEDIQKMYSSFLLQLEKQYPSAFDLVVKETMQGQNNISEKRKQALKSILAFRLKSSYSEDSSSIYENLYHPNSVNRIAAIKYLVQNVNALTSTEDSKTMVKDSITDRLSDDEQPVLIEILKISSDDFSKIMDKEILLEKLIAIFNKCNLQKRDWSSVKSSVIEHLTNLEIVRVCDTNRILLTLFPLIVSDHDTDLCLLEKISKKESINFVPFLKEYFELKVNKTPKTIKDFENIMQQMQNIPKPESILKSFESVNEGFYNNSTNCSFILLFLSFSFSKYQKTEISYKLKAFQMYKIIEERVKFVSQSDQFLQSIKPNKIYLSIILKFLLSLLKGFSESNKNCMRVSEDLDLLKNIFKVIITKAFSEKNISLKEEYGICLQNLLKETFYSTTEKLEYLSHYFIHDRINNVDYEFQIRAIKLFNYILNGNAKDFSINRNILIKIILGLSSSETIIRQITLETLNNILQLDKVVSENDKTIISKILASNEEILMDEFQITIVFYTLLCHDKTNNKKEITITREFLSSILSILNDDKQEIFLKSLLLNVMKLSNNINILDNIIDLGCKTLEEAKLESENNRIGFDYCAAEIYTNIAERFDSETISIMTKNKNSWNFVESSLVNYNILINMNGKIQSVATVIMNVFEPDVYAKMSNSYKETFLRYVLQAMSTADETSVSTTGSKMIKRIELDGNHIKNILIQMKDLCTNYITTGHRIPLPHSDVTSLNSIEWKTGITLLELLQNIKNIENAEVLIPVLFDLLKKCLEFEEQVALDYAKQLILSCLINMSQRIQDKKAKWNINDNALKMELVVQCIRSTQNPQTHHHALMLLSHFAHIVPTQILHNITTVFTFIGSSFVQHDDSFSFQIIINIIESVIPVLVEACTENYKTESNKRDAKVISILRVFSDIILDVPEHRRLLLYTKLIKTLNARQYLWMFLCILFESHVVKDEKERQQKSKISHRQHNLGRSVSPEELPKRLSIALQICKDFEPTIVIETCLSLFNYLKKLPEEKSNESNVMVNDVSEFETSLFEINNYTEKQFRHYKFSILQFMSALTSSPEFVNSIANLNEEELKTMKPYYQDFIIKILSFIPSVTTAVKKNSGTSHHKFWKIILHHCTEILDNAISLLSADMLLVVVHGLMQHQLSVVRKRVMELLNGKLQYKTDYFDNCNKDNMIMLLEPLKNIIKSILNKEIDTSTENSNYDEINIQHLALIAVKLLSRELALKRVEEFKDILNLLSKILKNRSSVSKIITAAVVLTLSEISCNLKAHSISNLYQFMPYVIDVLNDETEDIAQQAPDNMSIAILSGIYKLFDSLPLFLGPYYMDVLTLIIKIWVKLDNKISDNRTIMMYNKLNLIWTKISTSIPLRLLTPHCENVYIKLMEEKNFRGIIYLMKLLNESFNNTEGSDINILQNDLTKFFLIILDFRSSISTHDDIKEINEIESYILQTFVCLILKLSESSFRPLYQKLYDWAIRSSQIDDEKSIDRAITYFSLSGKIAEALKSLFVLFASDFIQDAANLLIKCNHKQENDEKSKELNKKFKNLDKCVILLENILNTLYNIFLHDTQGFINAHRFDILMQPIANQIENPLIINNINLQTTLLNCISQLTVVISNDVLWKQLNYEVLLKCRTNQTEVKILAVNTCVEIAKKMGEDFTSLLPETIPFMAELLEDENPIIEKAAKKAVQELEKVVGESLQKYF